MEPEMEKNVSGVESRKENEAKEELAETSPVEKDPATLRKETYESGLREIQDIDEEIENIKRQVQEITAAKNPEGKVIDPTIYGPEYNKLREEVQGLRESRDEKELIVLENDPSLHGLIEFARRLEGEWSQILQKIENRRKDRNRIAELGGDIKKVDEEISQLQREADERRGYLDAQNKGIAEANSKIFDLRRKLGRNTQLPIGSYGISEEGKS